MLSGVKFAIICPMEKIQIIEFLVSFIRIFAELVFFAILARVLISWFSLGGGRPTGRFSSFIFEATDPFIRIARKIPHRIGMLDLSPIIAMFGVNILGNLLANLLYRLV